MLVYTLFEYRIVICFNGDTTRTSDILYFLFVLFPYIWYFYKIELSNDLLHNFIRFNYKKIANEVLYIIIKVLLRGTWPLAPQRVPVCMLWSLPYANETDFTSKCFVYRMNQMLSLWWLTVSAPFTYKCRFVCNSWQHSVFLMVMWILALFVWRVNGTEPWHSRRGTQKQSDFICSECLFGSIDVPNYIVLSITS